MKRQIYMITPGKLKDSRWLNCSFQMNMQFDLGHSAYIGLNRHAVSFRQYLPTEEVRIEFPNAILFLNNVVSIIHLRPGLVLLSSSIGNVYPNPVIGKSHY